MKTTTDRSWETILLVDTALVCILLTGLGTFFLLEKFQAGMSPGAKLAVSILVGLLFAALGVSATSKCLNRKK